MHRVLIINQSLSIVQVFLETVLLSKNAQFDKGVISAMAQSYKFCVTFFYYSVFTSALAHQVSVLSVIIDYTHPSIHR